MILAEDGHDVTVLERDAGPPSSDPETIWEHWLRWGVPQIRQTHAFFGRVRKILSAELPQVLDEITAAGAVRLDHLRSDPQRPGDEDLIGIGARRTTLEAVLHRCVDAHARIDVLTGVAADGLVGRSR